MKKNNKILFCFSRKSMNLKKRKRNKQAIKIMIRKSNIYYHWRENWIKRLRYVFSRKKENSYLLCWGHRFFCWPSWFSVDFTMNSLGLIALTPWNCPLISSTGGSYADYFLEKSIQIWRCSKRNTSSASTKSERRPGAQNFILFSFVLTFG